MLTLEVDRVYQEHARHASHFEDEDDPVHDQNLQRGMIPVSRNKGAYQPSNDGIFSERTRSEAIHEGWMWGLT